MAARGAGCVGRVAVYGALSMALQGGALEASASLKDIVDTRPSAPT